MHAIHVLRSLLDPRALFHLFRVLHFYSYSHTRECPRIRLGRGSRIAPNVSVRNGCRIEIGRDCHIGERSYLWAGDASGWIRIGDGVSIAPEVFLTASDYSHRAGERFRDQPRRERDIIIGDDVWLGARVVVTAGVTIGDGCIVGAGAVVTRDLPAGCIAVGMPARVVGQRSESKVAL